MTNDTPQPAFQGRTETTAERLPEHDRWFAVPSDVSLGDAYCWYIRREPRDGEPHILGPMEKWLAEFVTTFLNAAIKERDTLTTQLREMRAAARRVVEACDAWSYSPAWGGELMENMTEAIGELAQTIKEDSMEATTNEGPGA